jgi:hypothetical protein
MIEPLLKPVILADTQQQVRLSMRRQLLNRDEGASACMECTPSLTGALSHHLRYPLYGSPAS